MNNVYYKGVLDAKISKLLTESDFNTFAALPSRDAQLSFLINNELVSTNIVTNLEALCKIAAEDLKEEVSEYTNNDSLYVNYFFVSDDLKKEKGAVRTLYNNTYAEAEQRNEVALLSYLDDTHALLTLLALLRGKKRGDEQAELLNLYLSQSVLSEEVFNVLVNSEKEATYSYLKNKFNIESNEKESLSALEAKMDEYMFNKLQVLAMESDLAPTLIYYIRRKQLQIERLRKIAYTKRNE